MPICLKCGKNESVIVGKAEYGGGFLCFKKKGGCGHKWGGKDVRTGQDSTPATEYPPLLEEWKKKLDPDTVNVAVLNGALTTEFKAIAGKHPERTKVWKMMLDFAESFGCRFDHGERKFMETI